MGPWLVFGALLNRCAMALFQGPPLGRPFGDFVSAARVTMLGVVSDFVNGNFRSCIHPLAAGKSHNAARSDCARKQPRLIVWLSTCRVCGYTTALVPWVAFTSCLLCGGCQVVQ